MMLIQDIVGCPEFHKWQHGRTVVLGCFRDVLGVTVTVGFDGGIGSGGFVFNPFALVVVVILDIMRLREKFEKLGIDPHHQFFQLFVDCSLQHTVNLASETVILLYS